jgi:hypothetical protein
LISACVGEAAPSGNAPPQGTNGGACFPNNSCNSGLVCVLSSGVGVCKPATDDGAAPSDSALDQASGQDTSAQDTSVADSSATGCTVPLSNLFTMCGGQPACFNVTQPGSTCNGCMASQQQWGCGSTSQCQGVACCLSQPGLTLNRPTKNTCNVGTLSLSGQPTPAAYGGSCKPDCKLETAQLCTNNNDCPTNTVCQPVQITGGGPPALLNVVLGVCSQ